MKYKYLLSSSWQAKMKKSLFRNRFCCLPELFCFFTGLNCPLKAHEPVKTSSPSENVGDCIEEVHKRKQGVVSPLLLLCEDNEAEEANMDKRYIQKAMKFYFTFTVFFFFIADEGFWCDSFFPLDVMNQI